jgi:hypothetical protein
MSKKISAALAALATLIATVAVALLAPAAAHADTTSWGSGTDANGGSYYVFHNLHGDYTIYTTCGPNQRGGPGYISKVVSKASGSDATMLDEPGDTTAVVDDRHGGGAPTLGIGKFVFRIFRQGDDTPQYGHSYPIENPSGQYLRNSWPVTGAMCASANGWYPSAPDSTHYWPAPHDLADAVAGSGIGVTGQSVVSAPATDSSGVTRFKMSVQFGDFFNTDILHVLYSWEFDDKNVKMWNRVVVDCQSASCMANGGYQEWLYVKGPKFTAGLDGWAAPNVGFKHLQTFDDSATPVPLTTCIYSNDYNYSNQTNKCGDVGRSRVRWDYSATPGDTNGYCSTTQPCFNAVMRAYGNNNVADITPGFASHRWEGSGYGMDQWAVTEGDYPSSYSAPNDTNCASAAASGPAGDVNRKWELIGYKRGYVPGLTQAQIYALPFDREAAFFFAWLDCTNVHDGWQLFRELPSINGPYGLYAPGASWGTFGSFAFNSNWTLS